MARRRIFLHIGLPKTATSYIQSTFNANRDAFEAQGVLFPRAGSDPTFMDGGHHLLPIALMGDRWAELPADIPFAKAERAWDEVVAEIEASSCDDVLLSSELFAFDVYRAEDIAWIGHHLRHHDVTVVLVLRDVVDFLNSVYSQRVRDGFDGSAVDYVKLAWPNLNWRELSARWQQVFGEANVVNLDYDGLRGTDILRAFVQEVFGRPIAIPTAPADTTLQNHSISTAGTELLREINGAGLDAATQQEVRDWVTNLYWRIGPQPRRSFLHRDLEAVLRHACWWPHVRDRRSREP